MSRYHTLAHAIARIGLALLLSSTFLAGNTFAQDRLTLSDGSVLEYYLALPKEESLSPLPLAIFMGGGSGNKPISFEAFRFAGLDLAKRGWAVVVPVSPENNSFRGRNVPKLRELMRELQKRDDISEGKILLAGISNGGMSAIEIARQNPEDYLGIVAVPAIVRDSANLESLQGMPVYLRIGGDDQLGWAMQFEQTVEQLENVGAVLDADVLPGEPHMFAMDWASLDSWLSAIRP